MAQLNRPTDKHGFPIPVTYADLGQAISGDNATRPDFMTGGPKAPPREFSPAGRRWKSLIMLALLTSVAGMVIYHEFGQDLKEFYAAQQAEQGFHAFAQNEPEDALDYLDAAVAWQPDKMLWRYWHAMANEKLNDLPAALRDLNEVTRDPRLQPEALSRRAMIQFRLHNDAAALADANRAVELNLRRMSERAELAFLSARLICKRQRQQDPAPTAAQKVELLKALEDVQAALDLEGNDSNLLDTRGFVLYLQGDYQAALDDLNAALSDTIEQGPGDAMRRLLNGRRPRAAPREQLSPESRAVLHQHRGLIYQALSRNAEAEADFQYALENGYDPARGVF